MESGLFDSICRQMMEAEAMPDTQKFGIGGSEEKYRLSFDKYSGDIGDALARSKGMPFSTFDSDNDFASFNCAAYFRGGWWYSACFDCNLNNWFPDTRTTRVGPKSADFMSWKTWKNAFGDINFSEIKIKIEN